MSTGDRDEYRDDDDHRDRDDQARRYDLSTAPADERLPVHDGHRSHRSTTTTVTVTMTVTSQW